MSQHRNLLPSIIELPFSTTSNSIPSHPIKLLNNFCTAIPLDMFPALSAQEFIPAIGSGTTAHPIKVPLDIGQIAPLEVQWTSLLDLAEGINPAGVEGRGQELLLRGILLLLLSERDRNGRGGGRLLLGRFGVGRDTAVLAIAEEEDVRVNLILRVGVRVFGEGCSSNCGSGAGCRLFHACDALVLVFSREAEIRIDFLIILLKNGLLTFLWAQRGDAPEPLEVGDGYLLDGGEETGFP
ncbi:hypothetical protein N657DRAFT_332559 [Parathielavia appendiculata]|uniref:Uncharacterized protein n=1 Tax=Parathielavia appendiculata TaxID=2587402 RepID=A0AAN6U1L3_9PEZI|nr:hypothetical protein N657DRAFT_332559 [Parathielavia appendiculata]